MDEDNEDALMRRVNLHPGAHQPTEPDEEAVLQALYGPPDGDGVYRETPPGGRE